MDLLFLIVEMDSPVKGKINEVNEVDLTWRRMRAYDDALALLRSIRAFPEGDDANIKFRAPSQKSPKKPKNLKIPINTVATNKVEKVITPIANNEDLQLMDENESSIIIEDKTLYPITQIPEGL